MAKTIDEIKADYQNTLDNLDDLIEAVIQKYRQDFESEISSVCAQIKDDDNSTKLDVIVVSQKDVSFFQKYSGKGYSDINRPSRIMGYKIRELIGNEVEDFIIRYVPEFFFYRRYDGE